MHLFWMWCERNGQNCWRSVRAAMHGFQSSSKLFYALLVLFTTCFLLGHPLKITDGDIIFKKNQLKRNINHSATAEKDIHLFGCVCQLGMQDFFLCRNLVEASKCNLFSIQLVQTWYTCSSIKLAEHTDFFFRFWLYWISYRMGPGERN